MLPLKESDRVRIVELARALKPHLAAITAAWRARMFEEFQLDGRAMAALERLNVGTGFALFCQSDFAAFFENLCYFGPRLSKLKVDTRTVARSLELYQNLCEPYLADYFPGELAETIAALRLFASEAFVTVSGAYFDAQRNESAALLAVLDAELSATSVSVLLDQVLRITTETFGASIGLLLLRDENDELHVHARVGLEGFVDDSVIPLGRGFTGKIAQTGEPDILPDLGRARGRLPRAVTVLLVSDEEVGSETSRAITERLAKKSAAVLVCEPAFGLKGALKTARKGVGEYKVKVFGRAAHAGLDSDKGQSAVVELARQIDEIARFADLKRGVTVNPGVVRGGTRSNVVAAEAEVGVDARVARLTDAPRLDRKFRSLRPFNQNCRLEVSGGINRPPLERTPAVVALFTMAQALARELGIALTEAAVGGGSDGNFTAALGVPTLDGMGAVGEGAHATDESVLVSQLAPRTALLARMIESV